MSYITIKHKRLAGLLLAILCAITVQAKKQEVYIFGVATSFNDSTVCITEIQYIPDAFTEDNRSKFLVGRENYSYQLRDHLAAQGLANRTCATYWATSTKAIEKKYNKVIDKYVPDRKTKKKKKKKSKANIETVRYDLHYLTLSDFSYKAVGADEGTVYVDAEAAERAARESKRKEKKEMPKGAPGQMPPQGAGRPPMPQQ